MRLFLRFLFPAVVLTSAGLFSPLSLFSQKPITLEDIWQKGTFQTKGIPGFNFQQDGVHFTKLAGTAIEQYDLRTGEKSGVIFDAASVTGFDQSWKGAFDGYSFSADESKILLATGTEPIYRWSTKAAFFVYDSKTKQITALHEGAKQRYATFSPDGSKVAFVLENDLYFKDLASGKTTRITIDGTTYERVGVRKRGFILAPRENSYDRSASIFYIRAPAAAGHREFADPCEAHGEATGGG